MEKQILLVDDCEMHRVILKKIFKDEYGTLEASNGQEAMQLLFQYGSQISVILLDLYMPVMDGFDLLFELKISEQLQGIPVIVVTDVDDFGSEIRALEMGAVDFIGKPFNPRVVHQRVQNIIALTENIKYRMRSEKDPLTGIYNREAFYEKAESMLAKHTDKEFSLLCLNVDKFKVINDLFGSGEGDGLLIYIASLWESEKDNPYFVMGRLNADNFALCMPRCEGMEEDILNMINQGMEHYPLDIKIIVRMGFYHIQDVHVPVSIMCDWANMAIVDIKNNYELRYASYNEKMRNQMLQEQEIINEMNQALEENQFSIYYQPKMDMLTQKIAGAEALVRWIHPTKSFISPSIFIPAFEKNGFISQLDFFVWESVCQHIREWLDKGYPVVPISVNVSRVELYNRRLCGLLCDLLEKYQIPVRLLQLEITETAYTENPRQLIEMVNLLKQAGFTILMDDFGSGYSSLNTLKDVPVDVLKIDLKFLYDIEHNVKGIYILQSVVQMAKMLELSVIAEGVETKQQVEFLLDIECTMAQGYYYARPLPKEDYEQQRNNWCAEE